MERVEIVLAHAGQRSVLSLREVLRCGRVSRRWWEACVYVFLYACIKQLDHHLCMYARVFVCLFVSTYVCMCVCMYVRISCMYVCMHACMHLRMYV